MIVLPVNYDKNKQYPVIVHGYGMPGTQIIWNRWGSTLNQYFAQEGYIVFSMDARGCISFPFKWFVMKHRPDRIINYIFFHFLFGDIQSTGQ